MSALRLTIEPHPAPDDVDAVNVGLRAFNVEHIGDPHEEHVHIFLRESDDRIVGGLLGHIRWRWLYVAKLWVDDRFRGAGHGSALIEAAERLAREHDCIGVNLDTFEYQARPFYEKLGYTVFGTLDGYPPGYRQFFLAKPL